MTVEHRRPDLTLQAARRAARRAVVAYGMPDSDADDVEGEILLIALERLAKGIPVCRTSLRFYTLMAARRVRLTRRALSFGMSEAAVDAAAEPVPSCELEAIALWQLQAAWGQMSDRQKQALSMFFLGYERHEIGEALHTTMGSACGAIVEAIEKIRIPFRPAASKGIAKVFLDRQDRRCKRAACRKPLPPTKKGEPQLFCNGNCRTAHYRACRKEGIPTCDR